MNILLRPVISEKTMRDASSGKYAFVVASKANKHQVAKNIEMLYKVEVVKVNVIREKPQEKIIKGRYKASSKMIKKAIITLKKGQKIEGFEVKE